MAVSKKKNPVPSEQIFVSQGAKRHGGKVGYATIPNPNPLPKKADVYLRIARKNAESCARYLRTADLYAPEDIQGPSSKWKREGRVFAIQHNDRRSVPSFPIC